MPHLPLLITVAAMAAFGSLLLKTGASQIGGFSPEISVIPKIITNIYILIGLAIYGSASFLWLSLLSRGDLSKLYPIFVGFDFFIVSILSYFILKENFNLTKIVGILFLLCGIYLISKS